MHKWVAKRDIVVIGASAGGIDALQDVVRGLPRDFPGTLFVVLHTGPCGSILPDILNRAGPLPAQAARDNERYQPGRIYVAAPNRHLLIDSEALHLQAGPRENGARPSIRLTLSSGVPPEPIAPASSA